MQCSQFCGRSRSHYCRIGESISICLTATTRSCQPKHNYNIRYNRHDYCIRMTDTVYLQSHYYHNYNIRYNHHDYCIRMTDTVYLQSHYYHSCLHSWLIGKPYNVCIIRKYGSTFYRGIAMVVLPYIGPWEN